MKTEQIESTCRDCGAPVTAVKWNGKILQPLCEECHSKFGKTSHQIAMDARESMWRDVCPSEFRFTDTEHKSWKENIEAISKVMAWEFSKEGRGLIIYGASGKCKTRSVWRLLKPLYIKGVQMTIITETQFSNDCGAKFGQSGIEARNWIEELCKVPLLFLDDIGKSSTTQRFSQEMFHVIDKRTSWRRPTIATLNGSGKELASKLGDAGPQIVRRLRDYCDIVTF